MSGSQGRPLSSSRTLAAAVAVLAGSISSAQPASTTLAAIQSVRTMMSQPVGTPDSSCGRMVAMNDSLSSIWALAYSTSTPYSALNSSRVGEGRSYSPSPTSVRSM